MDPSTFEKLGTFYLGKFKDQPEEGGLFLYDSRDLTTHAVCVGMTGSGKTGLCLALLEEAAMDGIPAVIIDPKGDLANLLLTFPELRAEDFQPWVDPDAAARKNMSVADFAASQADTWRRGLDSWGQSGERIRELRERVDMVVYTPGSTAGIPVNILASFDAPIHSTAEAVAEKSRSAAASLLGLLGNDADPVQSREGILLSTILAGAWGAGERVDISSLIGMIQRPSFDKVGVLDLETFYPAAERFKLVMALNNLLASPAFQTWRQGEPLNIAGSLSTPDGKPRMSIFSIAHLGDSERMFFVSLLLNEMLAWTRAQTGTSSLRAILYMDEIFGYLPPTANPPSKLPMMTLLKQARAFGVGVVLATQNPVDLDYKALSNAGTWFIGRLQTERDKARVLDGLASASGTGLDRKRVESMLSSLGNRVFLVNNVHEDSPHLFETRWVMSYLRGPLTRSQISRLMEGRKQPEGGVTPPLSPAPPQAASRTRPVLPPSVPQVFLPGGSHYVPLLLAEADLTFSNKTIGVEIRERLRLLVDFPDGDSPPDWENSSELADEKLATGPEADAEFEDFPAGTNVARNFPDWEKALKRWLTRERTVEVFRCREPRAISQQGESRADFSARLRQIVRERRDTAAEELRARYATRKARLDERLRKAEERVEVQKAQAGDAQLRTWLSVGSTVLGAFLGRKPISSTTISKASTAVRGVSRSMKEGGDVERAKQEVESIRGQITALEEEFNAELDKRDTSEPEIEVTKIHAGTRGLGDYRLRLVWRPLARVTAT